MASIFDIQTLATQDGPGIRTVIFFKGCPLRCAWCSNPEGQIPTPQLRWRSTKCTGCLSCMKVCKDSAVSIEIDTMRDRHACPLHYPSFDRAKCDRCKTRQCLEECPGSALSTWGRTITVDEILKEIRKDTRLFWNTGGGITFSGGEPFLYPDFISSVSEKLKELSIKIAVETCGFWNWDEVSKALELCDLVFFDVKTLDDGLHKALTGKSNSIILANLERLAARWPDKVTVSIPIIPGVVDTVEKIEATGKYLKGIGIKRVRILPYHNFSLGKYESLGIPYPQADNDREIDSFLVKEIKNKLVADSFDVE
jgi:pyruvate formate lyase activating enzyme